MVELAVHRCRDVGRGCRFIQSLESSPDIEQVNISTQSFICHLKLNMWSAGVHFRGIELFFGTHQHHSFRVLLPSCSCSPTRTNTLGGQLYKQMQHSRCVVVRGRRPRDSWH